MSNPKPALAASQEGREARKEGKPRVSPYEGIAALRAWHQPWLNGWDAMDALIDAGGAIVTTKPLTGYSHVTDKAGKVRVVKRAARMPAGQAANAYRKAARDEKRLRANAAKARVKG